jgi:hypothetical protein
MATSYRVDPPLLRQLGVQSQYERTGRRDGLAGVASTGEEERAGSGEVFAGGIGRR